MQFYLLIHILISLPVTLATLGYTHKTLSSKCVHFVGSPRPETLRKIRKETSTRTELKKTTKI